MDLRVPASTRSLRPISLVTDAPSLLQASSPTEVLEFIRWCFCSIAGGPEESTGIYIFDVTILMTITHTRTHTHTGMLWETG